VVITLRSILRLKEVLGGSDLSLSFPEGTTVSELLDYMRDRWGKQLSAHLFDPESGQLYPYVRIMVNGQTIQYLDGFSTILKDDDDVLFLPLVGGG
jgi:sulfur-carrier protein